MGMVKPMGRHSGFIAVFVALASGAETVCIPDTYVECELTAQ